jgi:hypothetical protein
MVPSIRAGNGRGPRHNVKDFNLPPSARTGSAPVGPTLLEQKSAQKKHISRILKSARLLNCSCYSHQSIALKVT